MPSRAFLFFNGLNQRFRPEWSVCLNALTGIFVFQSYFIERMKVMFIWSLNASRAFLFLQWNPPSGFLVTATCLNALTGIFVFNSFGKKPEINFIVVSMPSRAFLFSIHSLANDLCFDHWVSMPSTGIFVFQSYAAACAAYASLNALTGIFVFQSRSKKIQKI